MKKVKIKIHAINGRTLILVGFRSTRLGVKGYLNKRENITDKIFIPWSSVLYVSYFEDND
jgi:hypothetical protein